MAAERCAKCGWMRTSGASGGSWECPRCRIAYVSFEPGLRASVQRAEWGAREFFLGMELDRSGWALIAANIFAVGVGFATGLGFRDMLLVYWVQSMIIGACAVIRILWLPSHASAAETRPVALKFALAYGAVHAGYLAYIVYAGHLSFPPLQDSLLIHGLCAAVFAVNHGYSLYRNMRTDREGRPEPGDLAMLPFMRVVPMHVSVLVGFSMANSIAATLFFQFFKTCFDVIAHGIEHSAMRNVRLNL